MACRAAALAFIVHTGAFLAPRTLTQRCSLRASVDARDDSGETPLIKAAEAGDCDAVASLLQQGADATAESYTQWTAFTGQRRPAVWSASVCPRRGRPGRARAKSGLTPAGIARRGRDAAFERRRVAYRHVPRLGARRLEPRYHNPCPGKRQGDQVWTSTSSRVWAPRRSSPWSRATSSTCRRARHR